MARLIQQGEFIGRGERPAAAALEAELPDDWVIICNKQLVQGGSTQEVDFVVIARHAIFVIDEKSWAGVIRGNDVPGCFLVGTR